MSTAQTHASRIENRITQAKGRLNRRLSKRSMTEKVRIRVAAKLGGMRTHRHQLYPRSCLHRRENTAIPVPDTSMDFSYQGLQWKKNSRSEKKGIRGCSERNMKTRAKNKRKKEKKEKKLKVPRRNLCAGASPLIA